MDTMAAPPKRETGLCAYCGKNQGAIHSGVFECGVCWDWRKLNGPAARYWVAAIDRLFYDPETGSSAPDLIDIEHWDKWGLKDEITYAILLLREMRERYQEEIDTEKARRNS